MEDWSALRLGANCLMNRDSAMSKDCLELVEQRILKSLNVSVDLYLEECLRIAEYSGVDDSIWVRWL